VVDYLPIRTCELTVHTAGLALAIGSELNVPPTAGGQSLEARFACLSWGVS
jgi:hypothetical protein